MNKTTRKKEFVARALLFDQLTNDSEFLTAEKNVTLYLTQKQFLDSIQKEISDILNTRSSYSPETIKSLIETNEECRLSGIEGIMGLPSVKNIFSEGGDWRIEFAKQCEMMIRMYEPRIQDPYVEIHGFNETFQCLNLIIRGDIKISSYREHVSFAVSITQTDKI